MTALNPESPLPLYHQLASWLLAQIESGVMPTGEKIPSEPELARRFGIGRPTVRQATDLLIRRRRLERRRGSGTFVVDPPERVDLLSLAGTMESFQRGGIAAQTKIVRRVRREPVPEADPENPFAGREAFTLARVSRVDRVPVLLEEIHLDPDLFAGLEKIALAGRSLSKVISEHFHRHPTTADQSFRVAPAGERGKHLELSADTPVLLVKRTLHFGAARSAIYIEMYCRTDQLAFSQTLHAEGAEESRADIVGMP